MSDRTKLENLFTSLRNKYNLEPSHRFYGELKIYVDSASLDHVGEDGEKVAGYDPKDCYWDIEYDGIKVHFDRTEIYLSLNTDNGWEVDRFNDLDLDTWIDVVKQEAKKHLTRKNPIKAKRKGCGKTIKKASTKKYVVVNGVRYYAK